MKFLIKYIGKYWKPFAVAILFLTFEAVCDLSLPTIMSMIIDIGVANKDLDYVLQMGGLMLLITVFGTISALTRSIMASYVSQNFGADLRFDLFKKIQTLLFVNIDQFERASLVTRLTNDVSQVQTFINGLMRIFVKAPLLAIGGMIMASRLNMELSVVLLFVVPMIAILIIVNMKMAFPRFFRVQQALDQTNHVVREYLSGVRVVKAFNRFAVEKAKFTKVNQHLQEQSTTVNRLLSVFSPSIILIVNLAIIAVLWMGGQGIAHGDMKVGHIIAFINYMTQIMMSLTMISMVFNMFVRAKASAGRINEVISLGNDKTFENKNSNPSETIAGRIDFEHVYFTYKDSKEPALKDINFTIFPGETVGMIGSTGAGKTTLIQLLLRFYDVTSGVIKIDGHDIQTMSSEKIRENIAVVPQKTMLFTGSIMDNIRFGKENASEAEVMEAAQVAQVDEFISSSLKKYQTQIGQEGINLSGGQKQRISIARAIVKHPKMIIFDDSTSAVDVATESKIKIGLKKFAQGMTTIIISQRISSIQDAEKIIVLDQGEVVMIGRHDELLESCQVYQEIYQSQQDKEAK